VLVGTLQEDVVYALNAEDALADVQASRLVPQCPGKMGGHDKMVYLVNAEGCPTPTMAYLRSVYGGASTGQHQWANFVERIKGLAGQNNPDLSKLPSQVTEVSSRGLLDEMVMPCHQMVAGDGALHWPPLQGL
jgi:hypothetical protein